MRQKERAREAKTDKGKGVGGDGGGTEILLP